MEQDRRRAIRGPWISFRDDPMKTTVSDALHHEPDGLILIEDGVITHAGDWNALRGQLGGIRVEHYPDKLIMPGFVDTHVHYPQLQTIGAYGKQLVDWLEHYTFPAEQRFADPAHARGVADRFLDECLRAGTTTASVYCTVHPASVDAFFEAAVQRGMRMQAGKVLMDRNAPEGLRDTAQRGYDESAALIRRWHGHARLTYAITPRFAPSCSPGQLEAAGTLWAQSPGTAMQTHLSENTREVEWVRELFPERANYLDVYAHYGLIGPRAVFGHCLHLTGPEWDLLRDSGSAIAHCPTSNAFLGSGLFDFGRAAAAGGALRLGLATDVGAGTSLSMLVTMGAAYRMAQLGGHSLSAACAFYLATRGGARALHLADRIGGIEPGMEADLLVMDLKSTPLLEFRMRHCESLEEALFLQMTMADDRAIAAVYIGGALRHERAPA
ncbi:guanine deaminase [Alcaligenaceae bacterium]|nr:guanine deaminase [Alcaligenaceae bacterium]